MKASAETGNGLNDTLVDVGESILRARGEHQPGQSREEASWAASECMSCGRLSFWHEKRLAYPGLSTAPYASPHLPTRVLDTFDEARRVYSSSPRAAAALLRLALETLLDELGMKKGTLFDRIGDLESRGVHERVIQGMDALRLFGNDAIHNAEIVTEGSPGSALDLFHFLNKVAEDVIGYSARLGAANLRMPPGAKDSIAKRAPAK